MDFPLDPEVLWNKVSDTFRELYQELGTTAGCPFPYSGHWLWLFLQTTVFILFLGLLIVALSVWAPCPQGLAARPDSQFLCWAAFLFTTYRGGHSPWGGHCKRHSLLVWPVNVIKCSELSLPRRFGRDRSRWMDNWASPLWGMRDSRLSIPCHPF